MTFELRLLVVALAAFAWAGLFGTAVTAWLWRRPGDGPAVDRAARLLRIRLIPIAMAVSAAALAIVTFLLFESRRADEHVGWILSGLAAMGGSLLVVATVRGAVVTRATRRVWREWMATAVPLDVDGIGVPAFTVTAAFPVVAVVGFWRPRLVVARSVLASCSTDEVGAILRHERHHIDRRDNLRRAVLAIAPDVWSLLPASRRLLRAWHEATEEAADDYSRRSSETGGVALAQALLTVARLAPPGGFAPALPASALYRGENLERRVRRLLLPDTEGSRAAPPSHWIAPAAALVFALVASNLEHLHLVVEAAVTLLP